MFQYYSKEYGNKKMKVKKNFGILEVSDKPLVYAFIDKLDDDDNTRLLYLV